MQTGGRIKNIKRHKPPSKIRAFSGFQSRIGSNFIDDKSVFEKKNVFKAVREKGAHCLFIIHIRLNKIPMHRFHCGCGLYPF